ncbi:MAG: fatty acid hydroxylase family protein [Cytophagales bacterium]|nr:MAG: fatty acid hydroxylase family protein [Cytophagales bacterium]
MDLNPTVIAIPLYFLLMGIELLINKIQHTRLYRLNDAITNINIGATQQVIGVLLKLIPIAIYEIVYHNFSFQWIDNSQFNWWVFWAAFIGWDFCYYWAHRMSHEINLLWSGHVVHHQSEEYNLSVALRQSWFQGIWTAPFYLPLALIGFDTTTIILVSGLNLIYQYWIHTEMIQKMGILEWVMNTPSHHRVHHGRNPEYIDKNHAGVFIIWDRMFGTFQPEVAKPVYGITTPVASWNPVWANFAHFETIYGQLKEARSFTDYFKILFYKPGWSAKMAGYVPIPEVQRDKTPKYDTYSPTTVNYYVLFQYLITTVYIATYLFSQNEMAMTPKIVGAALIVIACLNMGGLFEKKKWSYWIEWLRFPMSIALLVVVFTIPMYVLWLNIGAMLISWAWLFSFRGYLQK